MHAHVGDHIVIEAKRIGEPVRNCTVIEVHGPDGTPPYVVRWSDTGHETLLVPGSDASVKHLEHAAR